jgi:hypothetical protein
MVYFLLTTELQMKLCSNAPHLQASQASYYALEWGFEHRHWNHRVEMLAEVLKLPRSSEKIT